MTAALRKHSQVGGSCYIALCACSALHWLLKQGGAAAKAATDGATAAVAGASASVAAATLDSLAPRRTLAGVF